MLYNKAENRKLNDKKVLHKVKKRWIVVSSAVLMALGGYAAATHSPAVHADSNNLNNSTLNNANLGKESVSQLTNQNGKTLNLQGQNGSTNQANVNSAAGVTNQAHYLHSQILQNNVLNHSEPISNQSNSTEDSSASNSRPDGQPTDHQSAVKSVSNEQMAEHNQLVSETKKPKKRSLGSAQQAMGTISVEDLDITNGDKDVNGVFPIQKPGGTPFNPSDRDFFTKNVPSGYQFHNVISVPTKFVANEDQVYKIGVVPAEQPSDTEPSRILLQYTDANHGNLIVGNHEFSNVAGAPFDIYQWEANRPSGYNLDPSDGGSNFISYHDPEGVKADAMSYFTPSSDENAAQPNIKYVPGTQLIQIGVKGIANNNKSDTSDSNKKASQGMAMMPVNYFIRKNGGYQPLTVRMAKGTAGDPFDITPFISSDIPDTYHFVGFHGEVPTTYDGNQSVGIVVAPNQTNNNQSDNSKNVTPPAQITMPVEYQYNGQTVPNGETSTTGSINSKFDITPYENSIPVNYRFAGVTGQEPSYYVPGSQVIIKVTPVKVSDATMPVSYVYNGKTVGTAQAKGPVGQPFDVTPFEQSIPVKGYHFDPQNDSVNTPSAYVNGYNVVINVSQNAKPKPSDKPTLVKMPISYVYNGTQVGSGVAYGMSGQPLNPQQYEQNVPNGYKYTNGTVSSPKTYTANKSIVINVVPIGTDNNKHDSQLLTTYITVQWVNGKTGKISDSLTLPGHAGQAFPLSYYESSAPEGTHSTGQVIGHPVTEFTNSNQTVQIKVMPNVVTPAVKYGTITVQCIDEDGHLIGHSDTTSHKAGTPFSLQSEMKYIHIPNNYHVVSVTGQNITSYQPGTQVIDLHVAPNVPSKSKNSDVRNGDITLIYINKDGNMVGTYDASTQKAGTPFNTLSSVNAHVPNGYQLVKLLSGANITEYNDGSQSVIAQVKSNNSSSNTNPQSAQGKITLIYMDNGGNVVGPYDTFTQKVGTPFDALDSIKAHMPSGYHLILLLDGGNVTKYSAGSQYVSAEVAANTKQSSDSDDGKSQTTKPSQQPTINNNPTFNPVFNNNVPSSSSNNAAQPNRKFSRPAKSTNVTIENPQPNYHHDNVTKHDSSSLSNRINSQNRSTKGASNVASAAPVTNASANESESNASQVTAPNVDTSANVSNGSAQNNANNGSQLPQTGESNKELGFEAMASVLAAIGASLTQLGYSLEKRRHSSK